MDNIEGKTAEEIASSALSSNLSEEYIQSHVIPFLQKSIQSLEEQLNRSASYFHTTHTTHTHIYTSTHIRASFQELYPSPLSQSHPSLSLSSEAVKQHEQLLDRVHDLKFLSDVMNSLTSTETKTLSSWYLLMFYCW